MTRLVNLPHLQTSAVMPHSWILTVRGDTQPAPNLLKGWAYDTPLHFESQVDLDLERVRDECGLGREGRIAVVALWWASSTNKRRAAAVQEVNQTGSVLVSFDIESGEVGGVLTLWRQVVLVLDPAPRSAFAAREPGSILWEEPRMEATTVILEGDAARFPTQVLDFSKSPVLEPSAAWWLDAKLDDLDASPLACLRLLVNGEHPRIKSFMASTADEATKLVSSLMTWDVGRKMVHGALDSSDFVEGWGSFRPGSLGEVLEQLIRKAWPGQDAAGLRSLRDSDNGLFDARLQGRFDPLSGAA